MQSNLEMLSHQSGENGFEAPSSCFNGGKPVLQKLKGIEPDEVIQVDGNNVETINDTGGR